MDFDFRRLIGDVDQGVARGFAGFANMFKSDAPNSAYQRIAQLPQQAQRNAYTAITGSGGAFQGITDTLGVFGQGPQNTYRALQQGFQTIQATQGGFRGIPSTSQGYQPYKQIGQQTIDDSQDIDSAISGEGFGNPTDQQIAQVLGSRGKPSPLQPLIPFIKQTASQFGVPLAVVLAIANQESGYGTDVNQATQGNNFFGLIDPNRDGGLGGNRVFQNFANAQQGITAAIKNMASSQYRNLSLRQYLALYLTGNPNGADDKAGNTVDSYVNNAVSIIRKLGGGADANSIVLGGGQTTQGTRITQRATGGLSAVVRAANSLIGVPYQLGGRRANGGNLRAGLDCSEFTAYAWEQAGVKLPWNAQAQFNATQRVGSLAQAKAGDLIFFQGTTNDPGITHVGLYLGNGKMINAQDGGVKIANVNDPYWKSKFAGIGRVR